RSLFFASAKKTNEKKADPAGGRAIRLSNIGGFVVRPGVLAGLCLTGAKVIVTALPNGHVVVPLIALPGERSTICRYRRGPSRHIACQWFRGGAGAVVKVLG
ncbi:hypothetical protein, partial [Cupriavidus basilensis]|uniref:hypothetical protein n=1 Tax=Cupriavidus basilensis TaxID=68895 RepID=UPI0020A6A0F6